jgi:hypothetical protein
MPQLQSLVAVQHAYGAPAELCSTTQYPQLGGHEPPDDGSVSATARAKTNFNPNMFVVMVPFTDVIETFSR